LKAPQRYAAVTQTIRSMRAKSILEVGTWNGERALAMAAAAFDGTSKVTYIGFDLFERMTADKSKAEFNAKAPTPEAQVRAKLETFRSKHPGFSFLLYKGDTRETIPKFLSQARPTSIDFVWLDGGHSVETVASDWESCRRAVRAGGMVLLDDFYSNVEPAFLKKFGCNTLVNRLTSEGCKIAILPTKDPVVGGGLVQIVRVSL
jgi:predicted O-methyltransferase YrrM